ncbi:unnamed protein product [Paramecium octaurelia]|uniref:Nudix hydrolase domain-containing protein n=1 Tax=Paramecium octaurelia TaxID=43137 RepID=A0A8S1U488_PAROT|nr:unnamed protein product [Paramecium octaurelia]
MNQKKQPQLACDAVCFRKRENDVKQVVLITRGHAPFLGKYAFPGGHLDYGEDPTQCCLRELREETGIQGLNVDLVDVRGAPDRDPRGHYVSIVYKVDIQPDAEPVAADDAKTAQWLNVEEILKLGKEAFAFDHYEILEKAHQKYP